MTPKSEPRTETVKRYHCLKCKHEWLPNAFVSRKAAPPLLCPKCHCRKWSGGVVQVLDLDPAEARAEKNARIARSVKARYEGLPEHLCQRCGHQWQGRSERKPRVCPQCHSPLWDTPRRRDRRTPAAAPRRLVCRRCGHEWMQRFAELPKTCPACVSPRWNTPRPEESRSRRRPAMRTGGQR